VAGYIPTPKTIEAFHRILASLQEKNTARAFTITAVYGTGKSAFGHYIACVLGLHPDTKSAGIKILHNTIPKNNPNKKTAQEILKEVDKISLCRGIATATREPIGKSVLKALHHATRDLEMHPDTMADVPALRKLQNRIMESIRQSENPQAHTDIMDIVKETTRLTPGGLLLILDELGKALEFSATRKITDASPASDLYLLQQIAEMPAVDGKPVVFLGLLHRSFADYGGELSKDARSEWAKIQGRFEDIPLWDSPENSLNIFASAFTSSGITGAQKWADAWTAEFTENPALSRVSPELWKRLYPLHPVTARLLPLVSAKYAQNERSVFTFLTGNEPRSFVQFIQETPLSRDMPTLQPHHLYDYFIESGGSGFSMGINYMRLVEVHELVREAQTLGEEDQKIIKTIGIFNLVSFSSELRASRTLVIQSLINHPADEETKKYYTQRLDDLIQRRIILYRKNPDDLRLWQGSDFDFDRELSATLEKLNASVARVLNQEFSLAPQIAQKHSLETGTLRYFFRYFYDPETEENGKIPHPSECDGIVLYPLSGDRHIPVVTVTSPVVTVTSPLSGRLVHTAREFITAGKILKEHPAIQTDAIARKEVKFYIKQKKEEIRELAEKIFSIRNPEVTVTLDGKPAKISKSTRSSGLGAYLSMVCDSIYEVTGTRYSLNNELINRREPNSGAARAQKILMEAMLLRPELPAFGLSGNGPEVTIYRSLLEKTGIHQKNLQTGEYELREPDPKSGIYPVFKRLEEYCQSAVHSAKPIDAIYRELILPPYGGRKPVLPLLFVALMKIYENQLTLYKEGSFIAEPGFEVYELLAKRPENFSVKFFAMEGLRKSFFQEMVHIFAHSDSHLPGKSAKMPISPLAIVKPLIRVVAQIPEFTRETKRIPEDARRVRTILREAREPDTLLFQDLPSAFGMEPFLPDAPENKEKARQLTVRLSLALREIQSAYENLLDHLFLLAKSAFDPQGVMEIHGLDHLRDFLSVHSVPMRDKILDTEMKRVLHICLDKKMESPAWIEAFAMVLADKPPRYWKDTDIDLYENQLSQFARRFHNLDFVLMDKRSRVSKGFDAKMVTVTNRDGTEKRDILPIPENYDPQAELEKLGVDPQIYQNILNNHGLRNALAITLLELSLETSPKEIHIQPGKDKRNDNKNSEIHWQGRNGR